MCVCGGGEVEKRDREKVRGVREKEREKERERVIDRQTGRQTGRQTESEREEEGVGGGVGGGGGESVFRCHNISHRLYLVILLVYLPSSGYWSFIHFVVICFSCSFLCLELYWLVSISVLRKHFFSLS